MNIMNVVASVSEKRLSIRKQRFTTNLRTQKKKKKKDLFTYYALKALQKRSHPYNRFRCGPFLKCTKGGKRKHGSQTSVLKHDGMNGSSIVADVVTSLDESQIYKRATGCKDGANSSLIVKLTKAT